MTRALIITLKNLSDNNRTGLIERIVFQDSERHLKSKNFIFDLQNTQLDCSKESTKYLVILQRKRSRIGIEDLCNLNQALFQYFTTEDSAEEVQKELKQVIKDKKDFVKNGFSVNYEELNSILELTKKPIPDAWIIGERETIILETKIGYNEASPYQIFRHITGKNGLNISYKELLRGEPEVRLVTLSWEDLCGFIKSIDSQEYVGNDKLLLNELLEYIIMTAQVLDFSYIINNKVDAELHKNQFELFLEKFDTELGKANLDISIERKKRKKSGLWEPYSSRDSNQEDPHYTISFSEKEIGIALTTKNMRQVKNVLPEIEKFYIRKNEEPEAVLLRYYINQEQYTLVDWKPGQMKGEHEAHFSFIIYFSEIKDNISRICNVLKEFTDLKVYKQFELGYSIQFYNFGKIDNRDGFQVRKSNMNLLQNPDQIIQIFIDFIKETSGLYRIMNG